MSKYELPMITTDDEAEEARRQQREIVKIRTSITNAGKAWREASNAYNKAVLELEKLLLSEVTPTENFYKQRIGAYEAAKFMAAQEAKLPDRKAALDRYHITLTITDEHINSMSDEEFHEYIISKQAERIQQLEPTPEPISTPTPVESREYRDWLESNDYNPDTHFISRAAKSCVLWKKVSTFNFPND